MNDSNTTIEHFSEGIVIKKSTGHCWVQIAEDVWLCTVSSLLRKQFIYSTGDGKRTVQKVIENDHSDPVAVGDRVRCVSAGHHAGMVMEVLPRQNRLARRGIASNPGGHAFEQVIAANIDLAIPIIAAAKPAPSWNLLDRNLASIESLELSSLVCISKLDLVCDSCRPTPDDLQEMADLYRQIGYEVLLTSSVTGEGIDELRQRLKNRTSVFIGKSGVGKSSLLNALQPGLGLRVTEVGQKKGKGRHTTTIQEMIPLDFGGQVIDTPGMREFGLWDVAEDDLAYFFKEMKPYVGKCKFGLNCLHNEEPGCAIRQAVMEGHIDPRRYKSFISIQQDGYFI